MAAPTQATQQTTGNQRFDAEAAAWDSKPFVHAMSLEAWKAIQANVPTVFSNLGQRPDILEIGCGTGLLSLEAAPASNRLVAIDASQGMIAVLKSKLEKPGTPENIEPIAVLLQDPEDMSLPPADESKPDGPRLKFDLVLSHLVLHHIADLKKVLTTMLGCLKEGGMVALTDFEDFGPDARRFHPESKMDGVERHGIPRKWMAELMQDVGFKDVITKVAWEHSKMVEKYPGEFGGGAPSEGQGELMTFPYIICLGRK
ncbi:S-adenosyl-L-methionine-dependent methyltransferase [Stachybotrys elegans]|uniref:S-adenosyl-L-methionine-dependent methyltransferase n=1 Tax=Stachybotrys elegans TaxID=80388 RepID=A0A8K0WMB3_9HYPO|nr:S-adenosyl-L-methionine-dependent methyltransferase [Stachybotrys elegans]